jgi:hypothetical protein
MLQRKFDSTLLLHSMPVGGGIGLTDLYMCQQHLVIHCTDPDDGGGNLQNVGF